MKISTKGRYGTRAMVDIGENYGKGPVSLRELAKRQGISIKYMEQIIPLLKTSGLVRSVRGARGGYVLARAPQEIPLRDIVHALEGSWSLVDCLDDDNLCARSEKCVTHEIWEDLNNAILHILDTTSLQNIIDRHTKKSQ
jgi:Rrf2 family transcriptional regulator, cysteine metabolism repressor